MEHRRGVLDRLYRGDDHDPALEAAAFPSPNDIECVKWFDARLAWAVPQDRLDKKGGSIQAPSRSAVQRSSCTN